ncbi:PREDICTED: LOW QUALITY PROTEIN: uncharacterized protein LOC108545772, partial [Eufriesea mexicana]|uniref:LOW QUALITY PROTEIN: uncharacterized protein LOC108545772 n=1 Tax=Eufriesea mexicana TaxID=516756 RepID=UPI00083C165E
KCEEDLVVCESEKMLLRNELRRLEKEISLKKKSINTNTLNISNTNSNNDSKQNEIEKIVDNTESGNEDGNMDQEEKQSTITKNETSSPYLPVKSRGVFALKQHVTLTHNTMKLSSSILKKKSRVEQAHSISGKVATNIIAFDGFGGHSKLEQFPSPVSFKINNMKDDIAQSKKRKL